MKPIVLCSLVFVLPLLSNAKLVAHWTLEEGSGNLVGDVSGSGYDGTVIGGATWTSTDLPPVPGGTTSALEFDGIDDQIDIIGYQGISGTGDRSITAWIKTGVNSTALNKAIASWGANIGTQKWTFRVQDGSGVKGAIRIEANGGYFIGNTVVTDAQWHHVAVTWANDGTPDILDAKLYVDGVLDAEFGSLDVPPSASQSVAINTAVSADVRIGQDFQVNTNHNWDGLIDDVRIYDEALDANAIAAIALGGQPVTQFTASAEIVASGSPVTLSWEADPANESLSIDQEVGDVLGLDRITVNPTVDTTYTITGSLGGVSGQAQVTVLVNQAPVIETYTIIGSDEVIEGSTVTLFADVFGETSLALNGEDVTGQDLMEVVAQQTTTYTLSATNSFGTSTAEVTITVLAADSPDLEWAAEGLSEGLLEQWDPRTNTTPNSEITFINNTGGTVQTGTTNFAGVSSWINSPGFNLSSNPLDSWQDGLGDVVTKQDVSWEIVVRPGNYTGKHTLFNTGGNGDGTAFVLTDGILDFRVQTANNDDQRVIVSTDLSALGLATEFFHAVATVDVESAGPGKVSLYVNGQLVDSASSVGILDDWDGGDLAELGKGNNVPTSTAFAPDFFDGDIALFSYYEGRILDDSQIAGKFSDLSGSGADKVITDISYDSNEGQLRITFTSIPGRSYGLESSADLSASNWLEELDSELATGPETTVVVPGVTLPDPGRPKRFYRVINGIE